MVLSKLDHPNIVKLYEFYEDKKHFYFVMEYFSGSRLSTIMKRKINNEEKFTEEEVARIMR